MAAQAVSHMKQWTGVPELRGIYCAGGWKPIDGRHESSSIPSLNASSVPAYHLPAPVMQKRLPEPPPTPEEVAKAQAWIKDFQEKLDASRAHRALKAAVFEKRYKPEKPPDWLKSCDPGPKPN